MSKFRKLANTPDTAVYYKEDNDIDGQNNFLNDIRVKGDVMPTLEQQDLAWEYWETVFDDGGSVGDMNLLTRSL